MDKVAMWSSPDHRRIDLQIPRHVLDVHNRTIDDVPSHAMLVSDDSFAYHRFDTIPADPHLRLEAVAVMVADSGTCFILLQPQDRSVHLPVGEGCVIACLSRV